MRQHRPVLGLRHLMKADAEPEDDVAIDEAVADGLRQPRRTQVLVRRVAGHEAIGGVEGCQTQLVAEHKDVVLTVDAELDPEIEVMAVKRRSSAGATSVLKRGPSPPRCATCCPTAVTAWMPVRPSVHPTSTRKLQC